MEPGRLEVYLGPAICGKCYEVGEDVAVALKPAAGGDGVSRAGDQYYADIRRVAVAQAVKAGIRPGSVAVSRYCTKCHNELFCSFRTEGERGLCRMWGLIGYSGGG